ncbi:MAG: UDP-N-acetylmuramate dehydrogenase [Acidobacteria bacterium]|nr:MAG: UDP-N-acetylmuramate dehydrogenase [Acidobacteriota bacterium]
MAELNLIPRVSLAELTTIRVGGAADWFTRVYAVEQLARAVAWATDRHLPFLFLGEGSNVLFPDSGFRGLVIKNRLVGFEHYADEVQVAGGENLGEVIQRLSRLHLAGLECMYGIPGTIAGAIVGNAGAYGQEIRDCIVEVSAWSPAGGVQAFDREAMQFSYRHSLLKDRRDLFVLSCRLRLRPSQENLAARSDEILRKRLAKYPIGLRCPGSFFKNILVSQLSPEVLAGIPTDFIQYGKIPAGRLLEEVGAKGASRGDALIAEYHGNLLINRRLASSRDVLALASEYAQRVWDRFQVLLEPEILVVETEADK